MNKKETKEIPKMEPKPYIPKKPDIKDVENSINEFNTKNKDLINTRNWIFQNEFKENKKIEHILIKIACVDSFDSANVFYLQEAADRILELKIDESLKGEELSLSLVNEIANVTVTDKKDGKKKERQLSSFASKYFSHHFEGKYPIYDQYVSKILIYFNNHNEYKFMDKFSDNNLRDYEFLNKCIDQFIEKFDLSEYKNKKGDIDKYLWLTGKELKKSEDEIKKYKKELEKSKKKT